MSEFLGAFGNPIVSGLMGLAQGFGQAAMPSRMPIPLGAAFGSAMGGMNDALTNAQKLKLLSQQEQRLSQQNAIQTDQWNQAKDLIPSAFRAIGQMPAGFGDGGLSPAQQDAPPPSNYTPPANAQEFIQRYAPHALAVSQATGLDPRLVLAQAGLESGWGTKAPGNNLFGIKGPGQTLATQESVNGQMVPQQASFRAYGSPEQSFQDYAAFIKGNPRYQSVMGAQGLEGQIDAMGRSGYATDPNYAGKLRMLARGIQLPEGAQPAAMAGGGQPSAPADMGAPPAASMPPAQVKAVNNIAQRAWQQASQLQSAAMAMTMNPFTKDMAPILMKQAEEYLKVGMWQPTQLPNGMQGFRHALTGEVKELSQPRTVQTYDQNGMMRTQLDQPNVTSFPQPGPTVETLGPDGKVRRVDQANPSRVIPGEVPLSLEQQSAAQVQSGQRGMTPSQASAASAASRAGAETIAKNTAEEWKSTRAAALDAGQRVAVLDRVEQALGNFTPGILADKKLWLGQVASQFGVSLPVNASEGEILKGLRSRMQLALTPRGQGQITESERGLIGAQFEVMMSTPQGAKEMISMIRRLDQVDMDVAKIYADNAERNGGTPNPIEVQREVQAYLQANPKPVVQDAAPQQTPQRGNALRWNVQKGAWE